MMEEAESAVVDRWAASECVALYWCGWIKVKLSCYSVVEIDWLYVWITACFIVEGGAIANLYAVLVARHNAQPEVKAKGLTNLPPLVVFQSDRVWYFFTQTYWLF